MATIALTLNTMTTPESASPFNNPVESAVATADVITLPNNGRTLLRIRATGLAGSCTVVTNATFRGLAVADITYAATIPASTVNGGVTFLGPFDPSLYNDTNGLITVNAITAPTGWQVCAIALP